MRFTDDSRILQLSNWHFYPLSSQTGVTQVIVLNSLAVHRISPSAADLRGSHRLSLILSPKRVLQSQK